MVCYKGSIKGAIDRDSEPSQLSPANEPTWSAKLLFLPVFMLLDSVTSQRRAFLVLSLVLVAVAASGFLASALWTTHSPFLSAVDKVVDSVVIEPILQVPEKPEPPKVEPWDVSNVLRGPPTDHFRGEN